MHLLALATRLCTDEGRQPRAYLACVAFWAAAVVFWSNTSVLSRVTQRPFPLTDALFDDSLMAVTVRCISGLVVEYIVAIDVTRARFPADAHDSQG